MATINFPSGTNQQLFVDFLEGQGFTDFKNNDSDVWVADIVLDDNPEVVHEVFAFNGSIIARHGYQ